MLACLQAAASPGIKRGIVTNNYWATSVEDAVEWLRPVAEIGLGNLSLSSDLFRGEAVMMQSALNAMEAAKRLGLPESVITIDVPEECNAYTQDGKGEPIVGGPVRSRRRAVARLAEGMPRQPWPGYTQCPDEDFADPGRVHLDAFGHVHLCQGLVMGNVRQRPLVEIVAGYDPEAHPIIGPLMEGGPAALVDRYDLPHEEGYIDACHLCYVARGALRGQYPEFLAPPTVYGEL